MGRRGPQPTPTIVLKARGSWRAKLREGEPQPPAGTPLAPERLTDAQRSAWTELLGLIEPMGLATPADVVLYERFVAALVMYRDCAGQIQNDGMLVADKHGTEYAHPLIKVMDAQGATVDRLGDRMGLSPAARTGLKAGERTERGDPKDRFFKIAK